MQRLRCFPLASACSGDWTIALSDARFRHKSDIARIRRPDNRVGIMNRHSVMRDFFQKSAVRRIHIEPEISLRIFDFMINRHNSLLIRRSYGFIENFLRTILVKIILHRCISFLRLSIFVCQSWRGNIGLKPKIQPRRRNIAQTLRRDRLFFLTTAR